MRLDEMLTDPDDLEDLANDFVEQELGVYRFPRNWESLSDKSEIIARWLGKIHDDPSKADSIVGIINGICSRGLGWKV